MIVMCVYLPLNFVDEYDTGVNAMALLCGLIISLPYQIIGSLNTGYFDQLRDIMDACPDGISNGVTFAQARGNFKLCINICIDSSVAGMVLSTFYFLFKRNKAEDFVKWRRKARTIVLLLFVSTSMTMSSLMYLTTLLLRWFVINSDGALCSKAPSMDFYMVIIFSVLLFALSIYLVY